MELKKDILKTVTRYAQAGEWAKVIAEYEKLLQIEPDDINVHNSIGDAFSKMGEDRKAFEHYLRVLNDPQTKANPTKMAFLNKKISKLDPKKFDLDGKALHETISKSVKAKDMFEKQEGGDASALPALKEALANDKMNPELFMMLGEVYEKQTDIGNAIESYVKALRIYVEKNNSGKGLELAKKIMNLQKENTDALAMIAEDMVKNGKKEEAEEMFKDVLINLAEKNLVAEGKGVSKRAMELGITYGEQFFSYFLFKDGKYEEARKILEKKYSLTLEEKLLLGKICYKMNDFEKAKSVFLSMDPAIINESEELLDQIGDVFLKLRELKTSSEYYMKVVRMLKSQGDLDHAMLAANKVLNVDGDNIEVHEILTDIYTKKQMKNKLIDSLTKLASLYDAAHRTQDSMSAKNMLNKLKML
ncbi:MAG: tetratricopeptide repeat protein [Candidatus Goldbacteria bacterium]|nr:tetratricopeptide repeat protein [Candidatus Goldiibacteriota bacterium]